ncbi:amino acid ABC transporter membrane protein 2 (PAAT family) [Frigoribacterium sp. PhB160]|uniref:amino acid ABC transporter permease n=1 Tax=Frigoribacterium sp. PhB160 TaxID=2485192 RepID=UPI000F463947|nr:amino acid ABC transporter permease [Frigoribacterium sp. PhB160]ROS59728.1 amino acid ABC transporter membrane protein 2 (PAAT family) [Frigoribacterium sp. PhB160]
MSTTVLYDAPGPVARRRSRIVSVVGVVLVLALVGYVLYLLGRPRVSANGAVTPGVLDPSRWDILQDLALWRAIGRGWLNTLRAAALASVLAVVVGVLFSFLRTARSRWVRVPTTVVLEFFRGMPVLLMMLFILLVFSTGAFWAVVIALSIYNGALIGEALRAGIASLPKGQREAGLALGLTPTSTRFLIEFPQAFRQMLPIILAQLVVLLKDTSLGYIVGYVELTRQGLTYLGTYYGSRYTFTLFAVVLVVYLVTNLLLSWVVRIVDRRTGRRGVVRGRGRGRGGLGGPGLLARAGRPEVDAATGAAQPTAP